MSGVALRALPSSVSPNLDVDRSVIVEQLRMIVGVVLDRLLQARGKIQVNASQMFTTDCGSVIILGEGGDCDQEHILRDITRITEAASELVDYIIGSRGKHLITVGGVGLVLDTSELNW